MYAQPQLIHTPLISSDVVYTPDWVAKDMVNFFNPQGFILEPCKGRGIFLKYLPDADWCEIDEGRDFFAWTEAVDWLIGNPPYSILNDWMEHSYTIAENIAYLVPMNSPFNSMKRLKRVKSYGGIKHIRAYGNGTLFGKNYGFAVGAIHYKRNYNGEIGLSIYD